MTASRLTIDQTAPGTLQAVGVIDAHTVDSLESVLNEQGVGQDITLDLRSIDFIDSSGLRVLVAAHQQLDEAGQTLTLAGPSEAVERLFEITGLRDHLNLAE